MHEADFQRVLEQGRQLQARLPEMSPVAVGGTAVALHCRHRVSLDVDVVTPHLVVRYDEVLANLEAWPGWRTNRQNPRVLILGERAQVDLGIRQQRRPVPLRTTRLAGLLVPTAAEMLRIKAFLLGERRAARDFVDVAALRQRLGLERSLDSLRYLNAVFGAVSPLTWAARFAEACEAEPADFANVELAAYKGLRPPFTDWRFVARSCQELGRALVKAELAGALPAAIDAAFDAEET